MSYRTTVLSVSFSVVASMAMAQDGVVSKEGSAFSVYGKVDNWTIYADQNKKSCLAESVDAAGTVLQMGLTENRELGYFGVFTQQELPFATPPADSSGMGKPDDPTKGEDPDGGALNSVPLTITLNGHVYEGKANKMTEPLSNGYRGGYIPTNNPEFVSDLENGQTMIAFSDLGDGIAVDLTGTKKAIEEAKACTAKLNQ